MKKFAERIYLYKKKLNKIIKIFVKREMICGRCIKHTLTKNYFTSFANKLMILLSFFILSGCFYDQGNYYILSSKFVNTEDIENAQNTSHSGTSYELSFFGIEVSTGMTLDRAVDEVEKKEENKNLLKNTNITAFIFFVPYIVNFTVWEVHAEQENVKEGNAVTRTFKLVGDVVKNDIGGFLSDIF